MDTKGFYEASQENTDGHSWGCTGIIQPGTSTTQYCSITTDDEKEVINDSQTSIYFEPLPEQAEQMCRPVCDLSTIYRCNYPDLNIIIMDEECSYPIPGGWRDGCYDTEIVHTRKLDLVDTGYKAEVMHVYDETTDLHPPDITSRFEIKFAHEDGKQYTCLFITYSDYHDRSYIGIFDNEGQIFTSHDELASGIYEQLTGYAGCIIYNLDWTVPF